VREREIGFVCFPPTLSSQHYERIQRRCRRDQRLLRGLPYVPLCSPPSPRRAHLSCSSQPLPRDYLSSLPREVLDKVYELLFNNYLASANPPDGPPSRLFLPIDRFWRFRDLEITDWSSLHGLMATLRRNPTLATQVKTLNLELFERFGDDTDPDSDSDGSSSRAPGSDALAAFFRSLTKLRELQVDHRDIVFVLLRPHVARSLRAVEVLHLRDMAEAIVPSQLQCFDALDLFPALRELTFGTALTYHFPIPLGSRPLPLPLVLGRLTTLSLIGLLSEDRYLHAILASLTPSTTSLSLYDFADAPAFTIPLSHLQSPASIRRLELADYGDSEETKDLASILAPFVNLEELDLAGNFEIDLAVASLLATFPLRRLKLGLGGHTSTPALLSLLQKQRLPSPLRSVELSHFRPYGLCDPRRTDFSALVAASGSSALSDDELLTFAFPSPSCDDEDFTLKGLLGVLEAAKRVGAAIEIPFLPYSEEGIEAVAKGRRLMKGLMEEFEVEMRREKEEAEEMQSRAATATRTEERD
jgi:hypothetical protein